MIILSVELQKKKGNTISYVIFMKLNKAKTGSAFYARLGKTRTRLFLNMMMMKEKLFFMVI